MSGYSESFILDKKFAIRLEMLSDWHVGTGAGIPGSIDALLAKDSEDFPQVPAKTIVGIWRDAMETLAYGLDGGAQSSWSKWVEVIFGIQSNQIKEAELKRRVANNEKTYSKSILSLQPARINENLRRKIKNLSKSTRTKYKQVLSFIKPEIRIDKDSGTTKTDMLRFAEMGRIGTILEADCKLDLENFTDDQKQIISALLIASAKLVERIGGKRRRGSGKCSLKVNGEEISEEIIDFLGKADASKVPMIEKENPQHESVVPDPDPTWRKLEYTLTLKTPVSIVTATLGNISESLDFIPGTYLLSHITSKLGKSIFKHIVNGDLQVSPATIEVNGNRGLPVPKVINYDKLGGGFDEDKKVYNRFNEVDRRKVESGEQKKNYREGYVSSLGKDSGRLPFHKKVSKTLLIHNTIEDDYQRPTSDVGGVYSRQAIAAETILKGEIRFKKALGLDFSNVSGEVRLGASKKDDYGLADFSILGESGSAAPELKGKELVVYFESDVLLRDQNLRQTNSIDDLKTELEKTFGKGSLKSTRDSLIQTRRIESWNVGWGFPRPSLVAMAAGSCVKFELKNFDSDNISAGLQKLESEGIGERRGEGYGRICFNPPLLIQAISDWEKAENPKNGGNTNENSSTLDDELKKYAQQLEKTAWREELQRAVLQIADDEDKRKRIFGFEWKGGESIPPLNQIGGLRSVIMRLKGGTNKNLVSGWLKHLIKTKNRRRKWDKDKDKATSKIKRIETLINEPLEVWKQIEKIWQMPQTIVRTKEQLQKELWAEAVRTLFDACMRAHKREGGNS